MLGKIERTLYIDRRYRSDTLEEQIMPQTTDVEIRSALHQKRLRGCHCSAKALVIDELGLAHGRGRVDVAVLNGWLHGYEIKSSKDTTRRLASQIALYIKCLEKITIVSAENHLENVLAQCPDFFGVIEAKKGKRGAIQFRVVRKEQVNPDVDLFSFAHLLWKDEAAEIVETEGFAKVDSRVPRSELYRLLSLNMTIRELSKQVKRMIMRRDNWRDPQRLVSCDDSYQLTST